MIEFKDDGGVDVTGEVLAEAQKVFSRSDDPTPRLDTIMAHRPEVLVKDKVKVAPPLVVCDAMEDDVEIDMFRDLNSNWEYSSYTALLKGLVTAKFNFANRTSLATVPGLKRVEKDSPDYQTRKAFMASLGYNIEDDQSLDRCARNNHDELNEAKGTDLWKKIRYNLPKYRRRRHQVLPFESTQEAFLHHFANIEDATIQTEEELRRFSTAHSSSAIAAAAIQMQVASEDLPSVYELEDAIRELQVGRSSIGCLPAEFLRADPAASATLLFPSLLALFRFFQQPMSWKGGQYFPLFKGKGSSAAPAGYRAILIGNAIPKVFHKILRKRLSRCVAPSLLPFQIGGLPRMSVHFAAHFLTELRHRAHGSRKSNAACGDLFRFEVCFLQSTALHDCE